MKKIIIILIICIVLIGLGGAVWLKSKAGNQTSTLAAETFTVKRGPLRICVLESGTVKSREQIILKNKVEGRVTILSIVPEGSMVKKGDLLVELDSSQLADKKIDQEIRVQNSEAALIQDTEKLAVTKNQAQSDIDKAELALEFAKQDLEKYIKGEYPNQLKSEEAKITLAKEELRRAEEKYEWSQKLKKEDYVSKTELEADRLSSKKRQLDLELAESDLALLKEYTYKRQMAKLQSDVKQNEMALERVHRKAKADIVQAESSLRAKEAEDKRQQSKLKKIVEQLSYAKIYSPTDGQVIYATTVKKNRWNNQEPLKEGREVREREELIYLPTANEMNIEVKIHEASVKKITPGQNAKITVGALTNKVFTGKVNKIAPMPDQGEWFNPNLKVYNTVIHVDGNDPDLRTGMSCKADILIEKYDDTIYVPIQCVIRSGNDHVVYIDNGSKAQKQIVKVGLDNNRMIRIIQGLEEGEKVLMSPPLDQGQVPTEAPEND